ncbi:DegT/DnrJ/EryC1/StrS family aminotransferase [Ammoniphilus sp. 3BR4]|uniref:DegT/DnrJ/EryC1/StrS family aminotransferase n=1 Tax=Ammoniphilus sp. 3BR4 TaxID=3158265 RepID=UPI003467E79A
MPVHMEGYPVAMDQLVFWAKTHNVKVIEDSAPWDRRKIQRENYWAGYRVFQF